MMIVKDLLYVTALVIFGVGLYFLLSEYLSGKVVVSKDVYDYLIDIYYKYQTRQCV